MKHLPMKKVIINYLEKVQGIDLYELPLGMLSQRMLKLHAQGFLQPLNSNYTLKSYIQHEVW